MTAQPEARTESTAPKPAEPRPPRGGAFLLTEVATEPVFTPEKLTEEQRMFFRTATDFVEGEVLPKAEAIEQKNPALLRDLLGKAGELGLLMIEIPERFGGLGSDVTTALLVAEAMARLGSWSVTIGAHTGIGTQPILFFASDAQKQKYLPSLATGEKIAAYALTEPGAGSDALAGRTKATLSEDGTHYLLNGSKQWITNGGIADVFVVFAKIDGDKFTGFIVEKGTEGFTVGPEEHKMGIRGSSTTTLHFEDARVPVENVLFEIGKGHKIAFNILNMGRLKLGFGATGGARYMLRDAIEYGQTRKTFGHAILDYGMIRMKLARMAALIHASESMAYRTAGMVDAFIEAGGGHENEEATRAALEEFAIESSIIKVFGSETLFYVADEDLQIHGGYGYVEDYMIERGFRDQRINRIFEGTNEINRLLVPGMLLKRAMKGTLALLPKSAEVVQALEAGEATLPTYEGPLARERQAAEAVKQLAIYVTAMAVGRFGPGLEAEQEVLGPLADVVAAAYAIDATVTRSLQHQGDRFELREALTRHFVADAWEQAFVTSRRLLATIGGEKAGKMIAAVAGLYVHAPFDFKATQEAIVTAAIEAGGYPLALG